MYSGIQNPEKELTDEEVNEIARLISELSGPEIEFGPLGLGHGGYGAFVQNDDGSHLSVMVNFTGGAQVWNSVEQRWVGRIDVSGICAYLCKLMTPAVAQHLLDANKMFSVP
jgi:hypothetical protein